MKLPRHFLTPDDAREIHCTAKAGAFWAYGQFWLAGASPCNPMPGRIALLLGCYDEPHPLPPLPDDVEQLVRSLAAGIPPEEMDSFLIQAAVLRATSREYYAL